MNDMEIQELFKQIESYLRKEDYVSVMQICTRILAMAPQNTIVLCHRAKAKFGLGNVAGAMVDLSTILAIDPENTVARMKRAEYASYLRTEDLEELVDQFPNYCRMYQSGEHRLYSIHDLPPDSQAFARILYDYALDRARHSEYLKQYAEAARYYEAYYFCGGTFDYDSQAVLERIAWLKQQEQGTSEP